MKKTVLGIIGVVFVVLISMYFVGNALALRDTQPNGSNVEQTIERFTSYIIENSISKEEPYWCFLNTDFDEVGVMAMVRNSEVALVLTHEPAEFNTDKIGMSLVTTLYLSGDGTSDKSQYVLSQEHTSIVKTLGVEIASSWVGTIIPSEVTQNYDVKAVAVSEDSGEINDTVQFKMNDGLFSILDVVSQHSGLKEAGITLDALGFSNYKIDTKRTTEIMQKINNE